MANLTLEGCKAHLLDRLKQAGATGLSKTGLGIKGTSKYAQALTDLERELAIGNLGLRTKSRYVLREYYRPLELAYEHIEAKAILGKPKLYTKDELGQGLTGPVKGKLDEAINLLVQDSKLLRLERGRGANYYLHVASLAGLVTIAVPEQEIPLDRERVLAVYREAMKDTGFSNVLIEDLRRRLNVPLEKLWALLLDECRAGRAVPSLGDWSLVPEAARASALHINGQPHLLIRLQQE
jgi:hypothetical protein